MFHKETPAPELRRLPIRGRNRVRTCPRVSPGRDSVNANRRNFREILFRKFSTCAAIRGHSPAYRMWLSPGISCSQQYAKIRLRGLPKLRTRVRFSSPALFVSPARCHTHTLCSTWLSGFITQTLDTRWQTGRFWVCSKLGKKASACGKAALVSVLIPAPRRGLAWPTMAMISLVTTPKGTNQGAPMVCSLWKCASGRSRCRSR